MCALNVVNLVLNDFQNDSRVWKISNSLQSMGFTTKVVALHSEGLPLCENKQGADVERVQLLSRPWPKWKPVQLLKYLEFVARVVWRHRSVDVVHCNDLNALPVGLLIKLLGRNVKVVYDCHEYETEINGLKGFEKTAKRWLERWLIRYADAVLTVSHSIAREYARLYGIPEPHLVLNCPSFVEQLKQNLFRERLGIRSDQLIFLYQGGLSKGRGIEILLDAFAERSDDRCVLVCMGYGPLESTVQAFAKRSSVIFYHPAVDQKVLLDHTSSADYGVSFIEDTCLSYRYCLPNKIFEYLMAGIPVLTSNLFEMRRLVESETVGLVAESNDPQGFVQALERALDMDTEEMKENVRRVRQRYCWEEQEKVLKEVYAKL
jgi:glycosyltransferase involved in cell wall biosynthesis